MNAYYHEFTPQITSHLYFWVAIVAVVVMAVLGWAQFRRHDNDVRKQFQDKGLRTVSGLLAFLLGCMITAESNAGLLQWLDNHLDSATSAAWSIIMLPVAAMAAAAMLWILLYLVGWGASYVKMRYLWHRVFVDRRKMIRKQAQRPAKTPKASIPSAYTGNPRQSRQNRSRCDRALRSQERGARMPAVHSTTPQTGSWQRK